MRFPLPAELPSSSRRWQNPAFEAELRVFVEETVGPVRLEMSKLRAWSTVWKAYDESGELFWAKQNCPGSLFEAALLALLQELEPDRVVSLTSADPARGLLLLPDMGEVLGAAHADIATWCAIVRQWAELQRELLTHTDEVAAVGVRTVGVGDCEQMLLERSDAMHGLPADDPRHLDDESVRRLEAALPVVRQAVEVVGALGLPVAANHNDLHGNNVFDRPGEALRFFDFGDTMLTDPAAVLLTPLGCLADALACADDDPRIWQVAEAWVEVWDDLAPATEIRVALPHALRLARLPRHESWLWVTPGMTEEERKDWAWATREHLGAVADRPMLAGR